MIIQDVCHKHEITSIEEHDYLNVIVTEEVYVLRKQIVKCLKKSEHINLIEDVAHISDVLNYPHIESIDMLFVGYDLLSSQMNFLEQLLQLNHRLKIIVFNSPPFPDTLTRSIQYVFTKNRKEEDYYSFIESFFKAPTQTPKETALLSSNIEYTQIPILTTQEKKVLKLVAQGYSSKCAGEKLCTSKRTIEKHKDNIRSKLDAKNITHAIVKALKCGILNGDDI